MSTFFFLKRCFTLIPLKRKRWTFNKIHSFLPKINLFEVLSVHVELKSLTTPFVLNVMVKVKYYDVARFMH